MSGVSNAELQAMLDELVHCFRAAHGQTVRRQSPHLTDAEVTAQTETALTEALRAAKVHPEALNVEMLWDLFLFMQKTAIVSRRDVEMYAANVEAMNRKLRELECRARGC